MEKQSEPIDKPWWVRFINESGDAELGASYSPNNGIRVDVCTDTTDGWETYFFYEEDEAEKLADRLKIWADMRRKGEYYTHNDDDIPAIRAKESQPSNALPLGALERASEDFQMAVDHWANGENFVCFSDTTQTIRTLLDNAIEQRHVIAWQPMDSAPTDETLFVCRYKKKLHVTFEAAIFRDCESWEIPQEYFVLQNMTTDQPIEDYWEDLEWMALPIVKG